MFTSPHLVDFKERIRVDGEMITEEAVTRIGNFLLHTDFGVSPTMFDYCLVMALLYFKEQGCGVIILETGLGGRLDSTNAVGTPEVSVITRIGYDHMEILGDTLEKIAAEKAGIIKHGTHLVLENQEDAVMKVLTEAADRAGVCDISQIRRGDIRDCRIGKYGQMFSFRNYENLNMRLLGTYQYENAAAAILAAEMFFKDGGSDMNQTQLRECIATGISNAVWPGRMEVLQEKPFFMVDGAHNVSGAAALADSLGTLFPGEKFHFIMGVMADKNYEKMVELLVPLALDFKTVTVEDGRALKAEELSGFIRSRGASASATNSLLECLRFLEEAGEEKTVAFGSLYFVGEIKAHFTGRRDITE